MRHILYITLILILTPQMVFALADVRANATVDKSTVTLGDVLENLDQGRDIWVMNAPAPGQKTTLSTRYLASLTREHNVYWQNSRGVRQITITRKGQSFKHAEFEPLIMQKLNDMDMPGNKTGISFDSKNAAIYLPEDSSLDDISLKKFTFTRRTGKFTALLSVPVGDGSFTTATVRGRTHAISYVPALNKVITPGQHIAAQDITWVSMPTLSIGRNIIRDKSQLIGMTPRRGLRSVTPLRLSDLERPKIVLRGKVIRIFFRSGKISLSALGKAIESGGKGDVIRVMNSKSHKTIEAVVTGPGQVQVITAQSDLAQLMARP